MADNVQKEVVINLRYAWDPGNFGVFQTAQEQISRLHTSSGQAAQAGYSAAPHPAAGGGHGGHGAGGAHADGMEAALKASDKYFDQLDRQMNRVHQNRMKMLAEIGRHERQQAEDRERHERQAEHLRERGAKGFMHAGAGALNLARSGIEMGIIHRNPEDIERMLRQLLVVRSAFEMVESVVHIGQGLRHGFHSYQRAGAMEEGAGADFAGTAASGAAGAAGPVVARTAGRWGAAAGAWASGGGVIATAGTVIAALGGIAGSAWLLKEQLDGTAKSAHSLNSRVGSFTGEPIYNGFMSMSMGIGKMIGLDEPDKKGWLHNFYRNSGLQANWDDHTDARIRRRLEKEEKERPERERIQAARDALAAAEQTDYTASFGSGFGANLDQFRGTHYNINAGAMNNLGIANAQDALSTTEMLNRVKPGSISAAQRIAALDAVRSARDKASVDSGAARINNLLKQGIYARNETADAQAAFGSFTATGGVEKHGIDVQVAAQARLAQAKEHQKQLEIELGAIQAKVAQDGIAAAREELTALKAMSLEYREQAAAIEQKGKADKASFIGSSPLARAQAAAGIQKIMNGQPITLGEYNHAIGYASDEHQRDQARAALEKGRPREAAEYGRSGVEEWKKEAKDRADANAKETDAKWKGRGGEGGGIGGINIDFSGLQQNIILKLEPDADRIANAVAANVRRLAVEIIKNDDTIREIKRGLSDLQAKERQRTSGS